MAYNKLVTDFDSIQKERSGGLLALAGGRLTSVQFILDFLILGLEAKGAFTTLVWPVLYSDGKELNINMPGYRDSLCSLIRCMLLNAAIDDQEVVTLSFDCSTTMRIALKSYSGLGERAILTGPQNYLLVF